jgi:hypothetical protein
LVGPTGATGATGAAGAPAWLLGGNSGTSPGTDFLGTGDAQPLTVKTGGTAATNERMRFLATPQMVVNKTTPASATVLSVFGSGTSGATNSTAGVSDYPIGGYSSGAFAGLYGQNTGSGRGVWGENSGTGPGVEGATSNAGGVGVYGHSANIGGYLGYEPNISLGTIGTAQGAGAYASASAAGYPAMLAQTSGAATFPASVSYSTTWIANYSVVDNSSATLNPPGLYAQLNNTNATMGSAAFKSAVRGYSNRATTAGNPGYTVGVQGEANSQNEDSIGVIGRTFSNASVTIGGYFEGNNYSGTNIGYAYVGGNDGAAVTKISGIGSVSEIIPTAQHGRITMTAPESPEYFYQDYGSVTLTRGRAHVDLDPVLRDIIVVDRQHPIRVFATPVEMLEFNGVTIMNQTASGFDLVELNGGTHSGQLDYQIVVKPKTNFGIGRYPQAPGPLGVKASNEPAAAKAANQPDPAKVYRWPADHVQYQYDPADYTAVGEQVSAGPHHGQIKQADGSFRDAPVVPLERPAAGEPTSHDPD